MEINLALYLSCTKLAKISSTLKNVPIQHITTNNKEVLRKEKTERERECVCEFVCTERVGRGHKNSFLRKTTCQYVHKEL